MCLFGRTCLKSSNFIAGVFPPWFLKSWRYWNCIKKTTYMTAFRIYSTAGQIWSLVCSSVLLVLSLFAPTRELGILSWCSSLAFIEQIHRTSYLLRRLHCPTEKSTTLQHLPHFSQVSSAPGCRSTRWMEVGPRWHEWCLDRRWWIAGQWGQAQLVLNKRKD